MISKTHPLGSFGRYPYVVILSRMEGKFLLSRHKQRTTWEFQGGHIERGETPLQAAKRELFEECGVVFTAEIQKLGPLPESEMAETRLFESLPEQMTYPAITAAIMAYWGKNIQPHGLTQG